MELTDIINARERIRSHIRDTPMEKSVFLGEACGGDVFLKLENLQFTNSFKVRGALNKILSLSQDEKDRGLVAASAGNHAQGIGHAARMLDISALIVVPTYTPQVKIDAIKRYGVNLIIYGDKYLETEAKAREIEGKEGKTFISAYNDYEIIAGQGTIGLEMLEQTPDLDAIIVPVGGGGLISGISCAVKSQSSDIQVIGVQSYASPVMYESLKEGRIIETPLEETIAEGLYGGIEEGSVTFDLCKKYVDEIILVEEKDILEAIGLMALKQRQIVEGSAAVGVAAILDDPERYANKKIGVVISGGNIEEELIRRAFQKV
jgi:threonine dehydratase